MIKSKNNIESTSSIYTMNLSKQSGDKELFSGTLVEENTSSIPNNRTTNISSLPNNRTTNIESTSSISNRSTNNRSTNNRSTNNRSTNNRSTNNRSTNNRSTNNRTTNISSVPNSIHRNIYYGKNKKSIMEQQKIHQKNVPFNDMLKEMKKRIDNEKRRLQIYDALGFSKTSSNNIIEGENLHMETKEISNENLNRTLSNNQNKARKYIELLQMDLEEYFNRYQQSIFRIIIGIITKQDRGNKIKSARQQIQEIIDNILKNNKQNGIIEYSKLKNDIIQKLNDLKMPKIYFDLFRTRKGIRNLRNQHIDINYTIMNTNNNELIKQKLERGYNFNTEKFIITRNNRGIDKLISALGINKIIRYGDTINKHMFRQSIVDKEITKSILEYMIDIRLPIKSIEDPIFTRKNEYLKTYISYQILQSFNSTDLFFTTPNSNRKLVAHGGTCKVFIKNNNILKYEHLRFKQPRKNITVNPSSNAIRYLFNNYIVFNLLIQSLIQNYLYNLDTTKPKVPNFISYSISYQNDLSLTIMEEAFNKNNRNNKNIFIGTLMEFIKEQSEDKYFQNCTINILKILKELCKVLNFFQEKCYFVHGDFHAKNIILYCEINENYLVQNISIKLIDFGFSSIIIDINGNLKILKDFGFGTLKMLEQVNPIISNIWNKIDILYLISTLIFNLNNSSNLKGLKDNINIKNFLDFFLKILNIPNDIYDIFLKNYNKTNKRPKFKLFISLFKSNKLIELCNLKSINKKKFYLNFIPKNLEILLDNYL